jgi:hypothetical protein
MAEPFSFSAPFCRCAGARARDLRRARGRGPAGPPASISRASWSSRRAMRAMATWRPMPRWCWPRTPRQSRAISPTRSRKAARRRSDRFRRGRRTRLHQSHLKPQVWADALRTVLREGAPTAKARSAAARRSMSNMSRPIRPGRCMSAIAAARCSAMRWPSLLPSPAIRRHARILHQRRRRAGRRARALGLPALPRGARRDIGEIPEGLYPGDYLVPVGQALAAEYGDKLQGDAGSAWLPIVRAKAIAMMMDDDRAISPRSTSSTTCSSPSAR